MSIRGNIANRFSGGPEYRVIPDRLLVEVQGQTSLSELVDRAGSETPDRLQDSPVGDTEFTRIESAFDNLGSRTKRLDNLGVLVVEIPEMENFIQNTIKNSHLFNGDVSKLESILGSAKNQSPGTIVGGFGPGALNFGGQMEEIEASLRNELMDDSLTNSLTSVLEGMDGIVNVQMSRAMNTFGPRNLNIDPLDIDRVRLEDGDDGDEEQDDKTDLGDVEEKLDLQSTWEIDSGESAIVAVFDTSFCEDAFDSSRVIDTFSGEGVNSAFSAPEEGHGTMCAYCAAGNESDHKFDYNGIAKDSDLLLARVSDSGGGLSLMAEAWDWLIGTIKNLDRPVISNHSYGMPVCGARGMSTCTGLVVKMARLANQRSDHQAFYAAGNEAQYCGHRLSGVTNGINGINSDTTSIASAALRFDLQDAQTYSSHGFGTCTNAGQNPKPDVGFLLPQVLPYGCDETDMSTNFGGSGGGTSAASPMNAGVAAIIASITGNAKRSVIENIMESTAEQPRATQINSLRGHDARFGNGQVMPLEAAKRADSLTISPTAGFTVSDNVVETGNEVRFDGTVSQTGDSTIETYNWDFGDGETQSGPRASHTYSQTGDVEVTLTITDDRGDTDSTSKTIQVVGEPEAVIDVPPKTFKPGETVEFDGSDSLNAVAYDWSFGDGTVGTGPRNSYSYDEQGDFTVTLQVENNIGDIDITETTVRVDFPDPEASIEADDTEIKVNESVELDASSSENADSYNWDLGDDGSAIGESVIYSYNEPGEYTVTVEIENEFGETDTDEVTITVTTPQPQASIEASSINVEVAEQVELDASGSQNANSYNWELGDGKTDTGSTVTHSYSEAGEYTPTVQVGNGFGQSDSDEVTITVVEPEPEDESEDTGGTGGEEEETTSGIGPLGLIDLGLLE